MIEVERAIVALLEGDPVLDSYGPGGQMSVWRNLAPEGEPLPYVLLSKQAGSRIYAHKSLLVRDLVYLVKAVDSGHDHTRAAQIDARLDALLTDGTLTLPPPLAHLSTRRESDIDYEETDGGVTYQHLGGLYRVQVAV
jgi:hypothetical protein